MHGCQANKEATCGLPAVLGLCPKRKYHPLCGWIFIMFKNNFLLEGKTMWILMLAMNLILITVIIHQGKEIRELERKTLDAFRIVCQKINVQRKDK